MTRLIWFAVCVPYSICVCKTAASCSCSVEGAYEVVSFGLQDRQILVSVRLFSSDLNGMSVENFFSCVSRPWKYQIVGAAENKFVYSMSDTVAFIMNMPIYNALCWYIATCGQPCTLMSSVSGCSFSLWCHASTGSYFNVVSLIRRFFSFFIFFIFVGAVSAASLVHWQFLARVLQKAPIMMEIKEAVSCWLRLPCVPSVVGFSRFCFSPWK